MRKILPGGWNKNSQNKTRKKAASCAPHCFLIHALILLQTESVWSPVLDTGAP